MKKLALTLAVTLALAVTIAAAAQAAVQTAAQAAALAVDGKALFARCSGCHGADGTKTALGNRALKGLSAEAVAKALAGYKTKTYGGAKKDIMEGMAARLSEADRKALADYISKL